MNDERNLDDLKSRLDERAIDLCCELFGKPTRRTHWELRWGKRGSVSLLIKGGRAYFHDFEGGTGGSLLDAIMFAYGLEFRDTITWARRWLGDEPDTPPNSPRRRPKPKPIKVDDEEEKRKAQAAGMWEAGTYVEGTIAETYLRDNRSIAADDWSQSAMRFIPRADILRHSEPKWQRWWRWDALMLGSADANGVVTSVQLIALQDDGSPALHWDGSGKKLKITRGPRKDTAVKFPGHATGGPLLLAEGPETAASCWCATDFETWATLGSISSAPLERVGVERLVIVCADDDPQNAPSNKSLNKAILRWRKEGRTVLKVKPWRLTRGDKSDFNDLLMAEGRDAVRGQILAAYAAFAEPIRSPNFPTLTEARQELRREMTGIFVEFLSWRPSGVSAEPCYG